MFKKSKNLSPLEVLVKNATSSKKQFFEEPTEETLNKLVEQCKSDENTLTVFNYLMIRLNDKDDLKHVEKSLTVCEHLILRGNINFPKHCSQNLKQFAKYSSYFYKVDGNDIGQEVRQRAKGIVKLVKDKDGLIDKRALAQGKALPPKHKAPKSPSQQSIDLEEGPDFYSLKPQQAKKSKNNKNNKKNKNKQKSSSNKSKKDTNNNNNNNNDDWGNDAFGDDPFNDMNDIPEESNEIEGAPNAMPNDDIFGNDIQTTNIYNTTTTTTFSHNDDFAQAFSSDDPFASMDPAFAIDDNKTELTVNVPNSGLNTGPNSNLASPMGSGMNTMSPSPMPPNNDTSGFGQVSPSNIFVVDNDAPGAKNALDDIVDPFASMDVSNNNYNNNTNTNANKTNNTTTTDTDDINAFIGGSPAFGAFGAFGGIGFSDMGMKSGSGGSNSTNNSTNNNNNKNEDVRMSDLFGTMGAASTDNALLKQEDIFEALGGGGNDSSGLNAMMGMSGASSTSTGYTGTSGGASDNPFAMFDSDNGGNNGNGGVSIGMSTGSNNNNNSGMNTGGAADEINAMIGGYGSDFGTSYAAPQPPPSSSDPFGGDMDNPFATMY